MIVLLSGIKTFDNCVILRQIYELLEFKFIGKKVMGFKNRQESKVLLPTHQLWLKQVEKVKFVKNWKRIENYKTEQIFIATVYTLEAYSQWCLDVDDRKKKDHGVWIVPNGPFNLQPLF